MDFKQFIENLADVDNPGGILEAKKAREALRQGREKAAEEQKLKSPLSKLLNVPSVDEENALALQNKQKFEERKKAYENEISPSFIGPHQENGPAIPVEEPFVSKRNDIASKLGIPQEALDLPIPQVKDLAEAKSKFAPKDTRPLSTQKALESGYASMDFLREVFPGYTDEQLKDVSVGTLQQKVGLNKSEASMSRQPNVPSGDIKDIALIRDAIDSGNEVKRKFFDLISKGKSPVDPLTGRWTALQEQWGLLNDAEVAGFTADLAGQLNTYLNNLSGAAISEQEAERLKKRLGKMASNPRQFIGQLDSFQDELNRKISNRVKTLDDAGYKVGDLSRLILKDTPVPAPKKQISRSDRNKAIFDLKAQAQKAIEKGAPADKVNARLAQDIQNLGGQ